MIARNAKTLTVIATIGVFLFIACKKGSDTYTPPPPPAPVDPVAAVLNLPSTPFNYANPALPAHFTTSDMIFQINTQFSNPITDQGATLGRVLFYDKNLSINNTISCASCHKQANGFSDPDRFSKGFNGGSTHRNSMSLINAVYYFPEFFFWDWRAPILEEQIAMPIIDTVEMGMTIPQLETKLNKLTYLKAMFARTYNGDSTINIDRISRAMSQFIRSIISYRAKYDIGRANFPAMPGGLPPNTPFPNFTPQENRGKEIFLSPIGGCRPCHSSEAFTSGPPKNNGLDLTTTDVGTMIVQGPAFESTFKVTSLRNVELTAPYMHDGRFNTLEQVVEHYNSGVKNHPTLAQELKLPNGNPRLLNLTPQDKAALVAFLKTLTDPTVATDEKYSNPFKN